jgi:hypothetical protein
MELSCPSHIGDDGRVDSWSERIIIGAIDAPPTISLIPDDEPGPAGGAIDIEIEPI